MLRFWLLGGQRPTLPWEFFITIGGALFGASVLFVFLFPFWTTYFWPGVAEVSLFVLAAAVLVTLGVVRWAHTTKRR
jgi:hypothetical protein